MAEPNFRALCAELTNELQGYKVAHPMHCRALLNRARAALLAQPEPVAPTDEELLKLLSRASGLPDCDTYIVDGGRIMSEPNELLAFARAVLARYGTPANTTREENLDD